jgi:hypothetical protein
VLIKDQSSEQGHWYDKNGSPAYQIIGANGKQRNTTLRDAKKLGLLPSVTTVIGVAAKPGLDRWKQEQAILAALTLPRLEGEEESEWLSRVLSDSKAQGKDAAQRGTDIHAIIESFFDGILLESVPEYCRNIENALQASFGARLWIPEKSGSHELGFGGKVDLHTKGDKVKGIPGVVVDFKTKEVPLEKVVPYDEHIMQMAAYRELLGMADARCGIVFVNGLTNEVKLCEITEEELQKGLKCFFHLLRYYQLKSGL